MLCHTCTGVFNSWREEVHRTDKELASDELGLILDAHSVKHDTFEQLRSSCFVCSEFYKRCAEVLENKSGAQAVEQHLDTLGPVEVSFTIVHCYRLWNSQLSLMFKLDSARDCQWSVPLIGANKTSVILDSNRDWLRLTFSIDPGPKSSSQNPWSCVDGVSLLNQKIESRIKNWLRTCDQGPGHRACERFRNSKEASLPTRLLHILPHKSEVKLVDAEHLPAETPYIALSHCWGGNLESKCTKANFADFQRGIKISALPATFQDAIATAVQLEILYIWIDALCLVQDCPEEWSAEAPKMGTVYSNATIVLAAAAAIDSTKGLMREGLLRGTEFNFQGRLDDACYYITNISDWEIDSVESNKLRTRGWAYQERLLASRTVSITKYQVHWECRSATSLLENVELRLWHDFYPLDFSQSEEALYREWQVVVRDYTQRDLTYPSDRPNAIAGIAKVFESSLGDVYCAGLWARRFITGLLWSRSVVSDQPKGQAQEFRLVGPTWSWLSVAVPVNFYGVFGQDSSELVSVLTIPSIRFDTRASADPANAVLTIEGRLICVKQISMSKSDLEDQFSRSWYVVFDSASAEPLSMVDYKCLRVLPVISGSYSPYTSTAHGLILEPATEPVGCYRRLGFVQFLRDHGDVETWQRAAESVPEEEVRLV